MVPPLTLDQHTVLARKCQYEVCEAMHIPYVDGVSLFGEISRRSGIEYSAFFQDAAHLKTDLIYTVMRELLPMIKFSIPKSELYDLKYVEYYKSLEDCGGNGFVGNEKIENISYSNSLMNQKVWRLRLGDIVSISIKTGESIKGLVVNASGTSAFLRISGKHVICKDLRFDIVPGDLKVIVLPLHSPVEEESNRVDIQVLNYASEDKLEQTYFVKLTSEAIGFIEIAGIIFRKDEEFTLIPQIERHLDYDCVDSFCDKTWARLTDAARSCSGKVETPINGVQQVNISE